MRNIMSVALLIYTVLTYSIAGASCDGGTVVVSGKTGYPPISWRTSQGLDGLGYSVIEKILPNQSIGRSSALPWRRVLKMAEKGKIDIIVGIRETEERSKFLTFLPTPLMDVSQNIFYMRGSGIQSREDLKGKVGGYISGTVFDPNFEEYAKRNLNLRGVASLDQNLKKLSSGRIQYLLSPLLPTIHYIKENNFDIDIAFIAAPIFTTNERIAISKKSACLSKLDAMDSNLRALKNQDYIYNQFDLLTRDWDVLNYLN